MFKRLKDLVLPKAGNVLRSAAAAAGAFSALWLLLRRPSLLPEDDDGGFCSQKLLGSWEWNPQTGEVHYNRHWAEAFGFTQDEVPQNLSFFIKRLHPEDRPSVIGRLTDFIEGRSQDYESEHRVHTKSGAWKWVLALAWPLEHDAAGRPLRVRGITLDISGREKVVEALENQRSALCETPESTSGLRFEDLFDLEEIQRIQDAFSDATGVASIITDTRGRPITRPSNFCSLCKLIRSTEKGLANCYRSDAVLGRLNAKGPTVAPCLSGGLFDGGASIRAGNEHIANWLIGQVRDETISDEKIMAYAHTIGADEQRFRKALAEVPHMSRERFEKIGQVLFLIAEQMSKLALKNIQQGRVISQLERAHAELRKAKEVAEEASRAKDEFIGVLSHELRTPLAAVFAAVSALREEGRGFNGDLELIQRNVALEARLIDDLLDVTRIARGKLEMEEVVMDVHVCLRSALEICEADAEGKHQRISLQLDAAHHHILGDSARIQQVFWNLLKNAIKFTPERGRIAIRTSNETGERIKIEVADSGIGIDPAEIPRIFTAFEQLGRTRRFGGLGLGLSIAKAVVEHHHGTLTCSSPGRDRGAVFTVELETVSKPALVARAATPAPVLPAGGEPKVLLVEDHRDTLQILTRTLTRWGYAVTPAESMHAALAAAEKERFDVLVSDLGLPDGSGIDLIRQLRIPGVALSGYGTESDLKLSREAGFSEHLVKPVGMEVLRRALEKAAARPASSPEISIANR